MKALPVFLLLLAPMLSFGQAWVNPLPVDSTTHKVSYQGVVQVPGATKEELYSRAREWFATYSSEAKPTIVLEDKADGALVGTVTTPFSQVALGIAGPYRLQRTIKVYTKEGRYRYELSDWQQTGPFGSGTLVGVIWRDSPIEQMFDSRNRWATDTKGRAKRPLLTVAEVIEKQAADQISALHRAMTTASTGAKDW